MSLKSPERRREKERRRGLEEERTQRTRGGEEERTQRRRGREEGTQRRRGREDSEEERMRGREKIEWEVTDSIGVFKHQMNLILRQAVKVVPLVILQYSSS